jgi:O-methyltransferase involved in polyketide biosynthesis
MSEKADQTLSGVAETLLLPLYNRAMESQRPDAMIKDEKAVELVAQGRLDFSPVSQLRITEMPRAIRIILTREIDRYAREYLARHPQAVVVHIGCGLDTRFGRVDNGQVEWYDLDIPDVIDLRRKFIGGEGERYHLLACSVLEDAWMEAVKVHAPRPVLFLAEGVFIFFTEAQVRSLVLTLRDRFPGAELVFDGWKPFEIWVGNRYLSPSKFGGLMQWGFWSGREIERWGAGIRLLDAWGFFDQPEPRLNSYRWMAPLFRLFKPIRVYHFQLGKAAG